MPKRERIEEISSEELTISGVQSECKNEDLIGKVEIKKKFLLSDDNLRFIDHVLKQNPVNPRFAPMKLYKLADVKLKSYEKYGGEEGLIAELKRREIEKFNNKIDDMNTKLLTDEAVLFGKLDCPIPAKRIKQAKKNRASLILADCVSSIRGSV